MALPEGSGNIAEEGIWECKSQKNREKSYKIPFPKQNMFVTIMNSNTCAYWQWPYISCVLLTNSCGWVKGSLGPTDF